MATAQRAKPQAETNAMPTREELDAVVQAANAGQPGSMEHLRKLLDANPGIWEKVGDLSKLAEVTFLQLIAGTDVLLRESLIRQLESMRAGLQGAKCSEMEKLLVNRLATAWLQLQYVTIRLSVHDDAQSIAVSRFVMSLRESAQRQMNMALAAITTFRKLAPTQFSIARPTVPFPGAAKES